MFKEHEKCLELGMLLQTILPRFRYALRSDLSSKCSRLIVSSPADMDIKPSCFALIYTSDNTYELVGDWLNHDVLRLGKAFISQVTLIPQFSVTQDDDFKDYGVSFSPFPTVMLHVEEM